MADALTACKSKGTIVPSTNFDAAEDAKTLRIAMKGLGCDEEAIIKVLAYRSNAQRQEIKMKYGTMFGMVLLDELKRELRHQMQELVSALLDSVQEYDANCLDKAMKGAESDICALLEIMCSRSNKEIQEIKVHYKKMHGRDLAKDLGSEPSGDFRKFLFSLAQGAREESEGLDRIEIQRDVKDLHPRDSDASTFNKIMASRSFEHLRTMIEEYKKIYMRTIEDSIKRNVMLGPDARNGMLIIVKIAKDPASYYAERLYQSMKGLGTDDPTLIRILVSRSEVDLVDIKAAFFEKYKRTLYTVIQDDTSGYYEKLLTAIVRY